MKALRVVPIIGFFLGLLIAPLSFAAKPDVRIIAAAQVPAFIEGLFRTDAVKKLATTPGHPVQQLIERTARFPLFVFAPTDHPASRLNFTAYMRLFAMRNGQYSNPLIADLYILHELNHISSMPYGPVTSYDQWNEKMTLNEKGASLFSEAIIHFISSELRGDMGIPVIWVDRYLSNKQPLRTDMTNQEFFAREPEAFRAALLADFRSIAGRAYTTLDATERRTWIYDRSNQIWAQSYWPRAQEIESEMAGFQTQAASDPMAAAVRHRQWLLDHMDDNGILFATEETAFHSMYKRLPHGVWQENEEQIAVDMANPTDCPECVAAAGRLEQLARQGRVERTPLLPVAQRLLNLGMAGTVYSFPYPETRHVTRQLWRETDPDEIFDEAYTRRQDSEHREFIATFKQWSAPVLQGLDGYAHGYPSNGSSEAIKDTLGWLRGENPELTVHIFEGEYEGVPAYAEGLHIKLKRHPRTAAGIAALRSLVRPGDVFYLSQPSGIDGNLWPLYDQFMQETQSMGLKVLMDLAYVGTVARPYAINLSYPHIEAVFFSLSKSFGTYYQRIGGAFTRRPQPLLYGNMWFKNLLSLRVGTALMAQYDVYRLPRLYQWAQSAAVQRVALATGMALRPSDVVLLANIPARRDDAVAQGDNSMLFRGSDDVGFVRYCLTPLMDVLVKRFGTFVDTDEWRCRGMLEPKPQP